MFGGLRNDSLLFFPPCNEDCAADWHSPVLIKAFLPDQDFLIFSGGDPDLARLKKLLLLIIPTAVLTVKKYRD